MKKIIIPLLLASFTSLHAQSLSFTNFTLESGADLQESAVYRFDSVIDGADALVTILQIQDNTTLVSIDDSSVDSTLDNTAFRPIINYLSPDGEDIVGSVSFGISFVEMGTLTSVTLNSFGAQIFDSDGDGDGDGTGDGDLREFVFSDGAIDFRGSGLTPVTSALAPISAEGSLAATSDTNPGINDTEAFRTDYSFDNVSEITFRFGAIGNDNVNDGDNDRLHAASFTGTPTILNSSPVPEPSSVTLLGISAIGLLMRRKR